MTKKDNNTQLTGYGKVIGAGFSFGSFNIVFFQRILES